MKKAVIGTLVVSFVLSGTQAFAQFKISSKSAKNLANLERVVARATKKPSLLDRALGYRKPGPVKLPSGVVVPGNAGLSAVKMPKTVTPVNQSFLRFINAKYKDNGWQSGYVLQDWIKRSTHNAFYTQQEQLAQDLDAFYRGIADIIVGPDGRQVKLYALPADGILYKPEGYSTPLVLNANEYFVIYDVAAKTGKIAENKPEVYNLFKYSSEIGSYGEFKFYELAYGVKIWRPKDPQKYYEWNRDKMRNDKLRIKAWENGGYPDQFSSEFELGKALYRFYGAEVPGVYQPGIGWYSVYELPKSVVLAQPGAEPVKLNPDDYVVIYRVDRYCPGELGLIRAIKRSEIENPKLFKFSRWTI